jgi:hypothetical protein
MASSIGFAEQQNITFLALLLRTGVSRTKCLPDLRCIGANKATQIDRRSSKRFALSLSLEARGVTALDSQRVTGITRNVSAAGMYFVCDRLYTVGKLLNVTINLSGQTTNSGKDCLSLTVRCRVQRVAEIFQNGAKRYGVALTLP